MATSISEIRKKYPDAYNDLSDIELADKIYGKYYQGKIDESEFYQKVFPNIASKKPSLLLLVDQLQLIQLKV